MDQEQNTALVVFEATGAYHRSLETTLASQECPFAKVNPRQARRFAEATGKLAKTDRVDAARHIRNNTCIPCVNVTIKRLFTIKSISHTGY